MRSLDRDGIFKAFPLSWSLKEARDTQSVAVSLEFRVLAELNGSEWNDWAEYEPHSVWGDFWIVKKDGKVNTTTVEQLAAALGWTGDLAAISQPPPKVLVQINVKADEYKGVTRYKAAWINPGDYSPRPEGLSDEKVGTLKAQFGSLLRAAAAGAAKSAKPVPVRAGDFPAPEAGEEPLTVDDTPF